MRRALPWLVAAASLLVLLSGVVLFAAHRDDVPWTTSTGSYAPLEPDGAYASRLDITFDDPAVLWTRGHLWGAGLAVLGSLALTGLGGWLLGRRAGRQVAAPEGRRRERRRSGTG